MADRVSQICTTVTFHLRNISRIRRYITQPACNNAIRSLVLSRLDYCNGLLSTIPVNQLDRIQRLQNWAARLIYQVSRFHSPKPLLDSLHWLPVRHRIVFKLLLLVFKSLNKQAPQYLRDCLTIYTPRRNVRSSSDPLRLTYNITRKLAGDRTFTITASKYWNRLPLTLRQSQSVPSFKKALKTFLFSNPDF